MSLLRVLTTHWDATEAAVQATYGVDLTGIYTGDLTLRRAAALVGNLPPGTALGRAMGGDAFWSDETAATLTTGWRNEVATLQAAGAKSHQLPEPPEPPEQGWQEKHRARMARMAARAARYQH